jgi:large subunit ribosomal protein L4
MIEIPVFNSDGQQVDTFKLDTEALGGEVRLPLLKQAYVRIHADQRQGTSATKNRARTEGSTRKLYKQKHTGNARRGSIRTAIMRGGGRGHGKVPHSWRKDMPDKMRRLANRNAILAKAVDGEIKLVDHLSFAKPNTKQFAHLLQALKIERSCLLAVPDTRGNEARSAGNLADISVSRIEQLNVFDLLNHRFLLTDKPTFEKYLERAAGPRMQEVAAIGEEAK